MNYLSIPKHNRWCSTQKPMVVTPKTPLAHFVCFGLHLESIVSKLKIFRALCKFIEAKLAG